MDVMDEKVFEKQSDDDNDDDDGSNSLTRLSSPFTAVFREMI
jgi:hypothetical protein